MLRSQVGSKCTPLTIIKNAARHASDEDAEEPKEFRAAEFRAITEPLTVYQIAQEIERRPPSEIHTSGCSFYRK